MTASDVLRKLKSLLEKTKQLVGNFSKIYPKNEQWDTLSILSSQLSTATNKIQDEIQALKEMRSNRVWEEFADLRSTAWSLRDDLFSKVQ
jgi:hypothetical protein